MISNRDMALNTNAKNKVVAYVTKEGDMWKPIRPYIQQQECFALMTAHGRIYEPGKGFWPSTKHFLARDNRKMLKHYVYVKARALDFFDHVY